MLNAVQLHAYDHAYDFEVRHEMFDKAILWTIVADVLED